MASGSRSRKRTVLLLAVAPVRRRAVAVVLVVTHAVTVAVALAPLDMVDRTLAGISRRWCFDDDLRHADPDTLAGEPSPQVAPEPPGRCRAHSLNAEPVRSLPDANPLADELHVIPPGSALHCRPCTPADLPIGTSNPRRCQR